MNATALYPRPRLLIASAFLAALVGGPAFAEDPVATPDEIPLLPVWCQHYRNTHNLMDTLPKPDQETLARHAKINQSGCQGVWHFCWAMVWKNRGIFTEKEQKWETFYLQRSVADFGYVLQHSSAKCALVPEIHVESGESQLLLRDYQAAEASFQKALKAKPGFIRAYVGLSDLYENRGQIDRAIGILQQGLKSKPNSNALKIKLKRVQERKSGKTGAGPAAPAKQDSAPPAQTKAAKP